jgi:hypothetical protein
MFDFSSVRTPQADHPQIFSTPSVNQNMNSASNFTFRHPSLFARSTRPHIYCRIPIEFGGEAKRDSSLPQIAIALNRIELDLQDLIVYTPEQCRSMIFPIAAHK